MNAEPSPEVRVTVWARTDPGRERTENQDSFLVTEFRDAGEEVGFQLTPHDSRGASLEGRTFPLGTRGALVLVADGMGGSAGGALASRTASGTIGDRLRRTWVSEPWPTPKAFAGHLRDAVAEANRQLHELAARDSALHGMGTTVTAVGFLGDHLYLAQVGDSRAYLVRGGTARQITRDQSMVQELIDAGALTEEQASGSVHRHTILQAVGAEEEVLVDLTRQQARRGDMVIVCSDGLSGLMSPEEISEVTARFRDPSALCEALLEVAQTRGSPDNVTVAAAHLDGPGLDPPGPEDPVGHQPFDPDAP